MRLDHASLAEAESRDRLSWADWEPGLDEARFVARERRLRSGWWPRSALESWVLRDGDAILASCETYRSPCTVHGEPGVAWSIASVWTEPALRGHGHASAMLRVLAERLSADPAARAIVLFSDVGPDLYARLGYVGRPAFDRVLPAEPGDPEEGGVALFAETELARVYAPRARPGFAIVPDLAQLEWHLDRSRVQAELERRPRPSRCGARVGDELAVWTDDGDELLVVLLDAPRHAPALLRVAARVAAGAGLARVRAWETPEWPQGLGQREARDGGLPMLLPLRPDVDPAAWSFVPRAVWV